MQRTVHFPRGKVLRCSGTSPVTWITAAASLASSRRTASASTGFAAQYAPVCPTAMRTGTFSCLHSTRCSRACATSLEALSTSHLAQDAAVAVLRAARTLHKACMLCAYICLHLLHTSRNPARSTSRSSRRMPPNGRGFGAWIGPCSGRSALSMGPTRSDTCIWSGRPVTAVQARRQHSWLADSMEMG